MKTKVRETEVDDELVERINRLKIGKAVKVVDKAIQKQIQAESRAGTHRGTVLRQCWNTIKKEIFQLNKKDNG